ncbi:MAG: imelysin family protein [Bacteroidota bacterium]
MKKVLLAISCVALVISIACSSNDSDGTNPAGYDRNALLTSWADNIIIPTFTDYQAKVNILSQKAEVFNAAPDTNNLAALRTAWLDAYKSFQHTGIFDIGKATTLFFIESSNTYPADATGIEANITSGSYNLQQYNQFPKQGFPGLDYLINDGGADTDNGIVLSYSNSALRRQYLTNVVTRLKQTADAIVADWNGSYRDTFVANNGNSVSSAVNQITNNFVKNFEKDVRAPKVGIPAGIFSNGLTYPANVEGYYKNDVSKALLAEALQSSQDFFNGKYFGSATTGPGLKAYLDAINATGNGQPLSTVINNQYTACFTAVNSLSNSFSEQVTNDNSKMLATYNVLQQQVQNIKVSMLQALSIPIDYVDGDGD